MITPFINITALAQRLVEYSYRGHKEQTYSHPSETTYLASHATHLPTISSLPEPHLQRRRPHPSHTLNPTPLSTNALCATKSPNPSSASAPLPLTAHLPLMHQPVRPPASSPPRRSAANGPTPQTKTQDTVLFSSPPKIVSSWCIWSTYLEQSWSWSLRRAVNVCMYV